MVHHISDRYDNFNEAGNWAQDSIPYVLQEFFGVPSYPKTAFNVIRLSMYQGRAMVMVSSTALLLTLNLLSLSIGCQNKLWKSCLCSANFNWKLFNLYHDRQLDHVVVGS